jgi:selT/selW/selH-like putative selenoprotein
LAAELKEMFPGCEVRLIPSSGGVFEVKLDGELIFSKKALRRHAEPGEVVRLVRERRGEGPQRAAGGG